MSWVRALATLREERRACVLVTLVNVRGHAPREVGAKLVVAADGLWGTVGGGNLEETALVRARALLASGARTPETATFTLSDHAHTDHGRQCCGGEVSVLLEPQPVLPCVAIVGMGHVGGELARLLARHDLDLRLIDSREHLLTPQALAPLGGAVADVRPVHAPAPEVAVAQLPPGAHLYVMTHDHAEDLVALDAALRHGRLGSVGVIGSRTKASRFRRLLAAQGHSSEAVAAVRCPIGSSSVPGKAPAQVALSVAVELLGEGGALAPGEPQSLATPLSSSTTARPSPIAEKFTAT